MNDDDLITVVKESVAGVHMTIPAEQIGRRSRAIRARRRIPGLAAALAVAAVAVVAVIALLPGHPGSHQSRARLAAWTVVKQADGTIRVTIRNLRDPAGLQAELRADGVPASVTFAGNANPACRPYPHGSRIQDLLATVAQPAARPHPARGGTIVVIHPSALPHGAGLQLEARFTPNPHPGAGKLIQVEGALVHASQQCTGS
jgi:hypothetical protein